MDISWIEGLAMNPILSTLKLDLLAASHSVLDRRRHAVEPGDADTLHFSRTFKRLTGLAPAHFRDSRLRP